MLTPEMIPAWLVSLSWLWAGFIWLSTRHSTIRLDSRIWGFTFVMTGLLYLLGYSPSHVDTSTIEYLNFRLFVTRIIMLLLSASMWLPMTISYYRMVKRAEHKLDRNNHSFDNSR